MDNWAIAYLSLEYTIMLSLLVFILVIFVFGNFLDEADFPGYIVPIQ